MLFLYLKNRDDPKISDKIAKQANVLEQTNMTIVCNEHLYILISVSYDNTLLSKADWHTINSDL